MNHRSGAATALVHQLLIDLANEGATLAVAESLTGGRLVAALTSVPGSSQVVRGAVVAYCSQVKAELLGVDPNVLSTRGPVCAEVAEQMARGARERLGATYGAATTGEAGPDSSSGQPVGTVVVAASGPSGGLSRRLHLAVSGRAEIQQAAVAGALGLLVELRAQEAAGRDGTSGDSAGTSRP